MIWFLLILLCTISAFFVLLDYIIKNFTTYKLAKVISGPYMYPLIGAVDFLAIPQNEIFQTTMKYCKICPNGFAHWTMGVLIYHIYSAEAIEKVVTNPKHIRKGPTYKYLHWFIGTGLLTSTGIKWMRRRKLLTPAFHFSILNNFQRTFSEQTALLINVIKQQEVNNVEGTDLQRLISRFTLNTICESAMGVKVSNVDQLDDYHHKINEIGTFQMNRLTAPLFYVDFIYKWFGKGRLEQNVIKQVHNFTGNIIATKRAKFQMETKQTTNYSNESEYYGKKQRFAMLDTLLLAELDRKIDAKGIQEEVDTFVFEGFDTTMTAVTFVLFMIAHHSDVQNQLFEEIESLATNNDYSEAKYLDAVIKETLRLFPSVPFISRILGEDTIIDNKKFPAGTIISIIIYMLHRDKRYFPNPEKFDPTRFLGNETNERHPFAYAPFSGGQRNCIGQKFAMMEMRTVISEIVRNFELKPITGIDEVEFIADLVLRPKDPIRIRFVPRGNLES